MISAPPPEPTEQWLKLEAYLDKLEPLFPPDTATETNPLGIDHFALLEKIAAKKNTYPNVYVRHYLNALRQMVAAERYDLKQKQVIEQMRKK